MTLIEAKILIEQWKKNYNQVRQHGALGYRPPVPEIIIPSTLTGSETAIDNQAPWNILFVIRAMKVRMLHCEL